MSDKEMVACTIGVMFPLTVGIIAYTIGFVRGWSGCLKSMEVNKK